ncbi:MAG: hypothetical protein K6E86_08790 [Bacteroidales bacterium]|nr:hypothetical protein [Bacteroidales bacterium]
MKRQSCDTGTYAPYKFCRTFGARYKCLAAPDESGGSRPRLYSRGPSARCLIETYDDNDRNNDHHNDDNNDKHRNNDHNNDKHRNNDHHNNDNTATTTTTTTTTTHTKKRNRNNETATINLQHKTTKLNDTKLQKFWETLQIYGIEPNKIAFNIE